MRALVDEEEALPNGLPVFPVYYENDDDGLRRWGKDSRLSFVAPRSADYFVRIRDARGLVVMTTSTRWRLFHRVPIFR